MPRYRLLIEYDGTGFSGWQRQKGVVTLQETLEEALSTVTRERIVLHASGRTDAGVHAIGQVAHFDASNDLDVGLVQRAINGRLQHVCAGRMTVLAVENASLDFHARYDARRRSYAYLATDRPRALDRDRRWRIRSPLDWERMNEAAQVLLGRHHFGSFCITKSTTRNRVCDVHKAEWLPERRPGDWTFQIEANRFVHGMVRAIVGTLVEVGKGKRTPDEIGEILAARERTAAGQAAPPHGLILACVHYEDGAFAEYFPTSLSPPDEIHHRPRAT